MWSRRGLHATIPAGEMVVLVGVALISLRGINCAGLRQMEAVG
jgi:hypothetical protein